MHNVRHSITGWLKKVNESWRIIRRLYLDESCLMFFNVNLMFPTPITHHSSSHAVVHCSLFILLWFNFCQYLSRLGRARNSVERCVDNALRNVFTSGNDLKHRTCSRCTFNFAFSSANDLFYISVFLSTISHYLGQCNEENVDRKKRLRTKIY